jgi:hypothetical protein
MRLQSKLAHAKLMLEDHRPITWKPISPLRTISRQMNGDIIRGCIYILPNLRTSCLNSAIVSSKSATLES